MTETGEGACCEVTGEIPVEERERRLSEARGTFLKQGEEFLNENYSNRKSYFIANSEESEK